MTDTTITTDALADEMAETYDITVQSARESVDTFGGQIFDIDGEEACIADRSEIRNGSGRVIGEKLTLTGECADSIRDAFAAEYAD